MQEGRDAVLPRPGVRDWIYAPDVAEERGRYVAIKVAKRQPPASGTPPLLEVQKLAKRFNQGSAAVADFSMRIDGGESVGLVGESPVPARAPPRA
jgi:hypothetical protein